MVTGPRVLISAEGGLWGGRGWSVGRQRVVCGAAQLPFNSVEIKQMDLTKSIKYHPFSYGADLL